MVKQTNDKNILLNRLLLSLGILIFMHSAAGCRMSKALPDAGRTVVH